MLCVRVVYSGLGDGNDKGEDGGEESTARRDVETVEGNMG